MELQILVSQKGTKVVTATNLHLVLGLPDHHYAGNIKRWINDIYEFQDGIRKATPLKDYARRKIQENDILKDFYLSLEFAKLIVLKTNSKSKLKWAQWLQVQSEDARYDNLITQEEAITAMELAKAMSLVAYQETCERQHLKVYESRNGGSAANWWKHRAQILGYGVEELRQRMIATGKEHQGKSRREILRQIDKYELIRTGVIDMFMALGKNEHYAKKMGNLAKAMAKKMKLPITDKKEKVETMQPVINSHLLNKILEREQLAKRA